MSGNGISRGIEFAQSSFSGIKFYTDVKKELSSHDHYTIAFLKLNCPNFSEEYLPSLVNVIKKIEPKVVDVFLENYIQIRRFFNEQQILDLLEKNGRELAISSKIEQYLLLLRTLTDKPYSCDKELIINVFDKHGHDLIKKVYDHRDLLINKQANFNAIINILIKLNSYTECKEYERKLNEQDKFFFVQRELSQTPSDNILGILSILKIMTQEWRESKQPKQHKPKIKENLTIQDKKNSFPSMINLHTPRGQVHTMENSLNCSIHPMISMKEAIKLQPPKISLDNIEIPKISDEEEQDIANRINLFEEDHRSIEQDLWRSKRRRFNR